MPPLGPRGRAEVLGHQEPHRDLARGIGWTWADMNRGCPARVRGTPGNTSGLGPARWKTGGDEPSWEMSPGQVPPGWGPGGPEASGCVGGRSLGRWGAERETGLGATSLPPALLPPLLAFPELGWRGHQQRVGSPRAARPRELGRKVPGPHRSAGCHGLWVKLFPAEPTPRLWDGHRTPSWHQQGTRARSSPPHTTGGRPARGRCCPVGMPSPPSHPGAAVRPSSCEPLCPPGP